MIHDRRQPNRKPATWLQVINPIWWASDTERNNNWSRWQWFRRNPFCNFMMVIIGISHCLRDCYYSKSPWTYSDAGWNYGWSTKADSPFCPSLFHIPYPFISYRGLLFEWAIGWKTSGGFTMSIRRANSPNAELTP